MKYQPAANPCVLSFFLCVGSLLPWSPVLAQPSSYSYWPPSTRYCLSDLCIGNPITDLRKLDLKNDDGTPFDRKRFETFATATVVCSALDLTFGMPYFLQQGNKTRVSAGPVPTSRDHPPKHAYRIAHIERLFPGAYTLQHAKEAIEDARTRWPGLGPPRLTDNYFHAFDDNQGVWFSARVGGLSRTEGAGLENVHSALVVTLAWSFYGSNSELAQIHFDAQPECPKKPISAPKF